MFIVKLIGLNAPHFEAIPYPRQNMFEKYVVGFDVAKLPMKVIIHAFIDIFYFSILINQKTILRTAAHIPVVRTAKIFIPSKTLYLYLGIQSCSISVIISKHIKNLFII